MDDTLSPPAPQDTFLMRSQPGRRRRSKVLVVVMVVVGMSVEEEQHRSRVFDVTAGDCKNEG